MSFSRFTVKEKMIWFLLPLIIVCVALLSFMANQLAKTLLLKEYTLQKEYVKANVVNAIGLIDAGFQMLDKQLEKDMIISVQTFKDLYDQQGPSVDLQDIKAQMGNVYDLVVIDENTTIIDATIKEGLNFNFTDFDPVLGNKINQLRLEETIVHEKIRTNVGTGLLSKFSYISSSDHSVLLEIVYNDASFAALVDKLDPLKTLDKLEEASPNIDAIKVFDIYGYEFTNSNTLEKPTAESLSLVARAMTEKDFEIPTDKGSTRYLYLPEIAPGPLSDHSRIVEIQYNATSTNKVIRLLSMIIFGVGTLIGILSIYLILVMIKRITQPLTALSRAAHQMSEGIYDVKVPVMAHDEIGQLTLAFNAMSDRVNHAYNTIENQLKTTLHSMGDGLISTNAKGYIEILNKTAEELTGWKHEEAIGLPLDAVFHVVDEMTKENLTLSDHNHLLLISRSGRSLPIETTTSDILSHNDEYNGQVIVFRDVQDKRDKIGQIEYLSFHDQLTGLYNRRYFEDTLVRLNNEAYLPLTLVMTDVNGLKMVNDAFGHLYGDVLLKNAADLMKNGCRSSDILARIGGDEFVILLPNTELEAADALMKRIQNTAKKLDMSPIIVSFSYGIATKYVSSTSISEIFKIAEDYMYRSKLKDSIDLRYQILQQIMNTLYLKSPNEKRHADAVCQTSLYIGQLLKLNDNEILEITKAAQMHDIGKIAMDLSLLDRKDALTEAERLDVERHPEIGYQLLKSINAYARIADAVLCHHENYDGSGYPRGLKGEEIHLHGRILALANAYDQLLTHPSISTAEEALNRLNQLSGKELDPILTKIFTESMLKS